RFTNSMGANTWRFLPAERIWPLRFPRPQPRASSRIRSDSASSRSRWKCRTERSCYLQGVGSAAPEILEMHANLARLARMNRRNFIRNVGIGTLASAASVPVAAAAEQAARVKSAGPSGSGKANLKLGTQHGDSDDILKVLAAFGV